MQTKTNENLAKLFHWKAKWRRSPAPAYPVRRGGARPGRLGSESRRAGPAAGRGAEDPDDILAAGGDAIGIATDVLKSSVAAARDAVLAKYGALIS